MMDREIDREMDVVGVWLVLRSFFTASCCSWMKSVMKMFNAAKRTLQVSC